MSTRFLSISRSLSLLAARPSLSRSAIFLSASPLLRLRPLAAVSSHLPLSPARSGTRSFATRQTSTSLNDPNLNWSNRPPKEPILLDGCDFEHWLVVVNPPKEDVNRDDIIDSYIKTLAQVVGSEEEARMKIYSVSTKHYFAFGALVSEELSYKLKDLPGVRWVLPDSYLDAKNKDYGGEPFINGQAVPYDPKYHAEWVRNNARANEETSSQVAFNFLIPPTDFPETASTSQPRERTPSPITGVIPEQMTENQSHYVKLIPPTNDGRNKNGSSRKDRRCRRISLNMGIEEEEEQFRDITSCSTRVRVELPRHVESVARYLAEYYDEEDYSKIERSGPDMCLVSLDRCFSQMIGIMAQASPVIDGFLSQMSQLVQEKADLEHYLSQKTVECDKLMKDNAALFEKSKDLQADLQKVKEELEKVVADKKVLEEDNANLELDVLYLKNVLEEENDHLKSQVPQMGQTYDDGVIGQLYHTWLHVDGYKYAIYGDTAVSRVNTWESSARTRSVREGVRAECKSSESMTIKVYYHDEVSPPSND